MTLRCVQKRVHRSRRPSSHPGGVVFSLVDEGGLIARKNVRRTLGHSSTCTAVAAVPADTDKEEQKRYSCKTKQMESSTQSSLSVYYRQGFTDPQGLPLGSPVPQKILCKVGACEDRAQMHRNALGTRTFKTAPQQKLCTSAASTAVREVARNSRRTYYMQTSSRPFKSLRHK